MRIVCPHFGLLSKQKREKSGLPCATRSCVLVYLPVPHLAVPIFPCLFFLRTSPSFALFFLLPLSLSTVSLVLGIFLLILSRPSFLADIIPGLTSPAPAFRNPSPRTFYWLHTCVWFFVALVQGAARKKTGQHKPLHPPSSVARVLCLGGAVWERLSCVSSCYNTLHLVSSFFLPSPLYPFAA